MEAQEALNEEALDDGQPSEILADLNDIDVVNQAPINHKDDYMRDYMMDKNKAFDNKLLDGSFNSHADAYRMLSLESTKKDRGNVIRQFRGSRSAFKTFVVCLTDKYVPTLAQCLCSYSAGDQKEGEERRQQVLHRRRG